MRMSFLLLLLFAWQSMYLLFSFSMACLYIGEVVFLAYIGIKKGAYETIAAVVLIFITIFWHMHVRGDSFHRSAFCSHLVAVVAVFTFTIVPVSAQYLRIYVLAQLMQTPIVVTSQLPTEGHTFLPYLWNEKIFAVEKLFTEPI